MHSMQVMVEYNVFRQPGNCQLAAIMTDDGRPLIRPYSYVLLLLKHNGNMHPLRLNALLSCCCCYYVCESVVCKSSAARPDILQETRATQDS